LADNRTGSAADVPLLLLLLHQLLLLLVLLFSGATLPLLLLLLLLLLLCGFARPDRSANTVISTEGSSRLSVDAEPSLCRR
jgi:hypothetical protein